MIRHVSNQARLRPLRDFRNGVPEGSLIVSDIFDPSNPESTAQHGGSVVAAARSMGFSGPIFFQQATQQRVPELEQSEQAAQLLMTPGLDPAAVKGALATFSVGVPIHMLVSGAEEVQRAAESGARNSVLNLSSGTCKAQVVNVLYRLASDPAVASNFATTFGLDEQALASSKQERHRLQQALVNTVDQAWREDSRLPQLSSKFRRAVAEFESKQNSVVIAAGNEGLIRPGMELETGLALNVPEDFEQNVLECTQVTNVGATIVLDGVEQPARYTSQDPGIDLYANGDKQLLVEFDDVRVAAVMADLHGQNPAMESDQVQELLLADFLKADSQILDISAAAS